jgi:cyclomaltodextrinase
VTCRVERWRSDPYYGAVAVVKAGNGYVVGDFSGWIRGALRERLGRDSAKLAEAINRYVALTPSAALPYMNTFLENHDLDRVATVFGGALQMGYALIFSLPGVPSVYAGGECGEEGKEADHTNRKPYTPCHGSPLRQMLTQLYKFRRELRLNRGPVWAEARGPFLVLHQAGYEVVVEGRRLVISNTHNNFEFLYK